MRYQNIPVDVDEKTLKSIADITGGNFYRATNNRALKEIYAEIDKAGKNAHRGQVLPVLCRHVWHVGMGGLDRIIAGNGYVESGLTKASVNATLPARGVSLGTNRSAAPGGARRRSACRPSPRTENIQHTGDDAPSGSRCQPL